MISALVTDEVSDKPYIGKSIKEAKMNEKMGCTLYDGIWQVSATDDYDVTM